MLPRPPRLVGQMLSGAARQIDGLPNVNPFGGQQKIHAAFLAVRARDKFVNSLREKAAARRICSGRRPQLVKKVFLTSWWTGEQAPPPGAAPQIFDLSRGSFAKGKT